MKIVSLTRPLTVLLGTVSLNPLVRYSSRLFQTAIAFTTVLPSKPKTFLSNKTPLANTNKKISFNNILSKMCSATTTKEQPVEIFRKDYKIPDYLIEKVSMDFNINDGYTTVSSTFSMKRNVGVGDTKEIVLDGEKSAVELQSLHINDVELSPEDYEIHENKLVIKGSIPSSEEFVLKTKVRIVPEENTQLSGLYQSSGMYCTQCEAMGFRRITYYVDRPDNMAIFEKVRIEADKETCPVLLSNGNEVEKGDLDKTRHYAVWEDPYPKPSYLFALVAGNLGSIKDTYTTKSGRVVRLEIFSEFENVNKLEHAMSSLKKSMKWDEDKFGLEYDLDIYNIVAVNDFNMGAMENKGLNVFNTAYVLASIDTATDVDYERVEGVIAHEYFHNWTGNRVTCRDWFQLTLKEGLTVYRDQEFSADMMDCSSVKRIEDVKALRGRQFAEDAGPMKHPIRPESYISMDNFYTATVYSKGAEVIRMYHTLLGTDGFRKGMDLYFQRHDGSAVTCDDFRLAMADANGVDLTMFARWYSTPGTPTVTYSTQHDKQTYKITFKQSSLSDKPLHIPIKVGLLDADTGKEIQETTVLQLIDHEQTFAFDVEAKNVIPSILRDFSAPIKLTTNQNLLKEYAFLAAYDTDDFNKWEAGQKLYTAAIFSQMEGKESILELVAETFQRILNDKESLNNYSITAYALSLPSESALMEELTPPIDPIALHDAREHVRSYLAEQTYDKLYELYQKLTEEINASEGYSIDSIDIGRRRLRNVLLNYLCATSNKNAASIAYNHYTTASGMTDKLAALSNLVSFDDTIQEKEKCLTSFYQEANNDPLVINKWFMVQAASDAPNLLDKVKDLTSHKDFTLKNPNRCRALISVFAANNYHFHAPSGEGYVFLKDIIKQVDKLNPQLSSRLATSFMTWRRFDDERSKMINEQLEDLKTLDGISDDLYEVVTRGLK